MAPNAGPRTIGSARFSPNAIFEDENLIKDYRQLLQANDFEAATRRAFGIPKDDKYTYHATASVTLPQVQQAVTAGPAHGLHDWYLDTEGKVLERPGTADVASYIALFDPSRAAGKTLTGMKANAKKNSLRASIAEYLTTKRYLDASAVVAKRRAPHSNPYIDFWAWSCQSLEYAGPNERTANLKMSHHVLPVFMHHFGCACPSYESLELIRQAADSRTILDIGSGNGYWTLMLRQRGCDVAAVDNGQSTWRTCWISDTITADGIQFIKKRPSQGRDDLLLMVYPIVSGDFTKNVIGAYQGDVVAVVGTQNGNGYTGFKDETIDHFMARERPGFEKTCQVPLPSFAGKDDALFIFQKRTPT